MSQSGGTGRSATFVLDPQAVQIGQPFTARAEVFHDSSDGLVEEIKPPFQVGEDWALFGEPTRSVDKLPGGGSRTTLTWEYMALEPGEHAVTAWTANLVRGGSVELPEVTLTVQGELTEVDESPRDLAPELPAPPPQAEGGFLPLLVLLLLLAFGALWWRGRKGATPAPSAPAAGVRERLQQAAWDESQGKELLFAWHRDLRLLADIQLGEDRRSWTDAEWIGAGPVGTGIAEGEWRRWKELLQTLETHKYGERVPSRLTGEELAQRVRELVDQVPSAVDSVAVDTAVADSNVGGAA